MELAVSSSSWLWQATKAELEFLKIASDILPLASPVHHWEGGRMKEQLSEDQLSWKHSGLEEIANEGI